MRGNSWEWEIFKRRLASDVLGGSREPFPNSAISTFLERCRVAAPTNGGQTN